VSESDRCSGGTTEVQCATCRPALPRSKPLPHIDPHLQTEHSPETRLESSDEWLHWHLSGCRAPGSGAGDDRGSQWLVPLVPVCWHCRSCGAFGKHQDKCFPLAAAVLWGCSSGGKSIPDGFRGMSKRSFSLAFSQVGMRTGSTPMPRLIIPASAGSSMCS